MALSDLRNKDSGRSQGNDMCEAIVPISRETDTLYKRAAQHLTRQIKTTQLPEQLLMGAVLSAASETDLVLGFLHQNLEVVSASTASTQLLMDELLTINEGTQELAIFGELRRERRDASGRTKLDRFIAANPTLLSQVQELAPSLLHRLVMQLMALRQDSRNVLPKYLETLALKQPELIQQLRAKLAAHQRTAGPSATQSNKISP